MIDLRTHQTKGALCRGRLTGQRGDGSRHRSGGRSGAFRGTRSDKPPTSGGNKPQGCQVATQGTAWGTTRGTLGISGEGLGHSSEDNSGSSSGAKNPLAPHTVESAGHSSEDSSGSRHRTWALTDNGHALWGIARETARGIAERTRRNGAIDLVSARHAGESSQDKMLGLRR